MDPIHPIHNDVPVEYALIPVILMCVSLLITIELGWWDKFIAIAVNVTKFPFWHWGG